MNPQEFTSRWIEGIKNITPLQQLKAKCTGTIGSIIGLLLAGVVMTIRGMWYFLLFMFFIIFLQIIQYIGLRQQYLGMKEMMGGTQAIQEDLAKKEIDELLGNVGD